MFAPAAIGIVGSRTVPLRTDEVVDAVLSIISPRAVVHTGDAPGIDSIVQALGHPLLTVHHAQGRQPWQLARRTSELVHAVAAGGSGSALVAFFAAPSSPGTRLACQLAVCSGIPTFAVPIGSTTLPALGAGQWVPTHRFPGARRWVPLQRHLF